MTNLSLRASMDREACEHSRQNAEQEQHGHEMRAVQHQPRHGFHLPSCSGLGRVASNSRWPFPRTSLGPGRYDGLAPTLAGPEHVGGNRPPARGEPPGRPPKGNWTLPDGE